MITSVEAFCRVHQFTIQAISAIGTVLAAFATVAAVMVSLYLARRSESIRLRVTLGVGLTNTIPTTQLACIAITNVGLRDAWLPILFFEWRVPFRKKGSPETLTNWINGISSDNPDRIAQVGQDKIFSLGPMEIFREKIMEDYLRIAKTLKWFKATRLKRIRARIYTQDDREFVVIFAKVIRDELSHTAKKSNASRPT